jgi:hypothetical protein
MRLAALVDGGSKCRVCTCDEASGKRQVSDEHNSEGTKHNRQVRSKMSDEHNSEEGTKHNRQVRSKMSDEHNRHEARRSKGRVSKENKNSPFKC